MIIQLTHFVTEFLVLFYVRLRTDHEEKFWDHAISQLLILGRDIMIQLKINNSAATHKSIKNDLPPLLKKFVQLQSLNPEAVNLLLNMHAMKKTFAKGKIIYEQDNINKDCFIVTHGWAYRYTDLYDGSRQVISYYLPGDIINPFASAIPKSNYSVAAITNLRVSICKPEYLMELFATQPKLGLLYTALLSCGDASMAEQIVRIGRRSAYQRVTHLLLELYYRLRLVGHAENYTFYLPVTQSLLADTLGLSVVHMNRTLYKLRLANLIRIRSHKIDLINIEKLMEIAEYKCNYLEQLKNMFEHEEILA